MNPKQRETMFNQEGGRCAYCGEPLIKGWPADELLLIRRTYN